MNCKTANQMIHSYLNEELSLDEADDFLHHIKECAECREELEIYFTVQKGIDNLSREVVQTYDLKGLFEQNLENTRKRIRRQHTIRGIRNAACAAAAAGIAAAAFLQLKIWL